MKLPNTTLKTPVHIASANHIVLLLKPLLLSESKNLRTKKQ